MSGVVHPWNRNKGKKTDEPAVDAAFVKGGGANDAWSGKSFADVVKTVGIMTLAASSTQVENSVFESILSAESDGENTDVGSSTGDAAESDDETSSSLSSFRPTPKPSPESSPQPPQRTMLNATARSFKPVPMHTAVVPAAVSMPAVVQPVVPIILSGQVVTDESIIGDMYLSGALAAMVPTALLSRPPGILHDTLIAAFGEIRVPRVTLARFAASLAPPPGLPTPLTSKAKAFVPRGT